MESSMLEPGIFRHPRPKKSALPPPNKKRRIEYKIEEISFDDSKREDYLTGFHKRKVQRIKLAQEENEKKAREERREMRKQLREERKEELEEHVEAVNRALREVEGGFLQDVEEEDVWGGIEDDVVLPILPVVDHEEEYVDEDRYTTVTVEAVDVSKEGLKRVADDDSSDEILKKEYKSKAEEEKGKKKWPKKEKKKKFRYESKAERKITRGKQKAGNKAKADARKDN